MKHIAMAVFAAALLVAPARAAPVANGGFETGDFTGWTVTGDGLTIDTSFAVSGTYDASFGAAPGDPAAGTLSQAIATAPGASYTLAFSLLDESGAFVDTFSVGFGGFSATITGDMAPGWTAEQFLVPGGDITGDSTTLSFAGANVSAAWNLDDVAVAPAQAGIPEPAMGLWLLAASAIGLMTLAYRRRA